MGRYLGTTTTHPEDRKVVISQPWVMFESDSSMVDESPPQPQLKPVHPRGSACTAMILGFHVREQGLMRLEEAIRKMTSLAMQRIGIVDRGVIRPGMWADITVFDKDTIALRQADPDPKHIETFYPVGIHSVTVNGRVVIEGQSYTQVRAGQVLRK